MSAFLLNIFNIFILQFVSTDESKQWHGVQGANERNSKEGSLKNSCLCWVMQSYGSRDTHSHNCACRPAFESAMPCTMHQKGPQVISFGKKDEDLNGNPLNMVFIKLCTTCLWIKNILLKRRGLSCGRGWKASCTCLGLAAWTVIQSFLVHLFNSRHRGMICSSNTGFCFAFVLFLDCSFPYFPDYHRPYISHLNDIHSL